MPQFLQNLQRYANNPLEFVNGVVRVGSMIGNEIEYGRKQVRGFIEDVVPKPIVNTLDSASLTTADVAQFGYENSLVGLAEQGAIILGGNTTETFGLPRGVGEFVGGALAPGIAASAPSAITRAKRAVTKDSVKTAVKETAEGLKTIGDDLMPPPPAALATAGSAPSVQLNVSGGKANLQVMEARAKPGMTQEEWDTQRGAEIRIKRTKVEDAKVAMENIEANNPGVSKGLLKEKDIGDYKTYQRRYEDGQAEVSSAESNIPVPTPDNPYAFPRGTPGAVRFKEEAKAANEALGRAAEQLELHHLIPKGMSAAIYNRARDFIEKGLVDPKYLNRIAEKFKKITGADTGDLRSGILPMRNTPHKTYHNEMRFQPSDTFPGESMEIMKEALTTKLNQINNPKDFEILLDNLIRNDIKPLVDNARIWENTDDVIRSVSPDFTGKALPDVLKKRKLKSKKTRQKKTNK
tara:strand:+ start:41 stop:1432 length:1392 start_codon:yes stop_codon:yes gene_type:complete